MSNDQDAFELGSGGGQPSFGIWALDRQAYACVLIACSLSALSGHAKGAGQGAGDSDRGVYYSPSEVSVFHGLNRCVRRCFLCGKDAVSGRDYEYRKAWLEERLRFLAGCFGIDVLSYSI